MWLLPVCQLLVAILIVNIKKLIWLPPPIINIMFIFEHFGIKYILKVCSSTGHFSKAEKEKEREKDPKRREEKERSDGHEGKHNSSEKHRRKEEKKRKHRESSPDRSIPIKR